MVRPHGIKGPKGSSNKRKKKNKREERYDKEEEEEEEPEPSPKRLTPTPSLSLSNKEPTTQVQLQGDPVEADDFPGIPILPVDHNNYNNSSSSSSRKPGVVFVLEKASLEVAKVGKSYQILNSEEHSNFLKRNNRNPADYRPDIAYQALLSILDSPLNKAGRVRAVYVKTEKGVLFEVKPHVRIPRTYKRFAGIMLQLLQKLSITAMGKREKLMRVIKNPVSQYLPLDSRKIGFSFSSEKLVNMRHYVDSVSDNLDLVFVVGAMAHGKIDCDYIEDFIAISGYPLSAAWCISRICEAVAGKWNLL